MNRNIFRAGSGRADAEARDRWARLVGNDVAGIDGDIERTLGLYQAKYGYTRDKANAELVRRLSLFGYGHDAPRLEDSCL